MTALSSVPVVALAELRPRGVVFDLDGTLTDNMALHAQAFEAFVRRHGLPPLTMAVRKQIDGKRNAEIFPLLFKRDMTPGEVAAFEDEKEGAYRDISRNRLRPLAGAIALLDALHAHGIGVAVATAAPARNVAHTLAEIGLAERMPIIARSEALARGKPFPDVFLHAAERLGVPAGTCLAFEDATVGVRAARAAGMTCVAVMSTYAEDVFAATDPPPHATVADFDAFLAGPGAWLVSG